MRSFRRVTAFGLVGLTACATLQQLAALREVDFSVDRLSNVRLAGIDLARVTSYSQLSIADAGRLAAAVSRRTLPMDFQLHLTALNPESNSVDARLVRLDFTLLLQSRETLSGVFAQETLLRRGQPTDLPIAISVDLLEFFEGSAQDLLNLALSLAGRGGPPTEVTLRATPTIETALGPIRYPRPITIVSATTGG